MELQPPVFYLETDNFNETHQLKPIDNPLRPNTPLFHHTTIVMIQGNFCGYCTRLKPIYQQIANHLAAQSNDIHFATIQTDETPTPNTISQEQMKHIFPFDIPGVPTVVKFYQGKVVDVYQGQHDAQELHAWIVR